MGDLEEDGGSGNRKGTKDAQAGASTLMLLRPAEVRAGVSFLTHHSRVLPACIGALGWSGVGRGPSFAASADKVWG